MVVRAVMSTHAAWENGGEPDGIPALYLGTLRAWTIAPRSARICGVSTSFHLQYRLKGCTHYWIAFCNVMLMAFANVSVPDREHLRRAMVANYGRIPGSIGYIVKNTGNASNAAAAGKRGVKEDRVSNVFGRTVRIGNPTIGDYPITDIRVITIEFYVGELYAQQIELKHDRSATAARSNIVCWHYCISVTASAVVGVILVMNEIVDSVTVSTTLLYVGVTSVTMLPVVGVTADTPFSVVGVTLVTKSPSSVSIDATAVPVVPVAEVRADDVGALIDATAVAVVPVAETSAFPFCGVADAIPLPVWGVID